MAREIITSVERRRKWPDEEKLRIMSEALVPGAATCAVADRNGVCRSLLYTWLRLARDGQLPGIALAAPKSLPAAATFVPVTVQTSPLATAAASPSQPTAPRTANPHTACVPATARRRVAVIEVVLSNGRTLKVAESIDPALLARFAAALDDEARLRQNGAST